MGSDHNMEAVANHGLGRDVWNVPFDDIQYILYIGQSLRYNLSRLTELQVYFWGELTYLCVLSLTKISILFFYLRIFPHRDFKCVVWALISANICYLLAFELSAIFQCSPVSAAWRRWDGEHPSKCNDINLLGWLSAICNIVLDLCILILPMPELHKLSMSPKKKFNIILMFSVGFLWVNTLSHVMNAR